MTDQTIERQDLTEVEETLRNESRRLEARVDGHAVRITDLESLALTLAILEARIGVLEKHVERLEQS